MPLAERINDNIKAAMKSKDQTALMVLRAVKTAMTNLMIEKKKDDLQDEDVLMIIQKQAKQRKESIESFEKASRMDLADKEKAELAILENYLPAQLSEEDLERIIREAAAACGAETKADMGKLMKEVMPAVKGKADGRTVNRIVAKILH